MVCMVQCACGLSWQSWRRGSPAAHPVLAGTSSAHLHSPLCRACVAVPDANLDRSLCSQADQVLNSLLEFRPEEWGLPAFKS